jgi:hypothetical protein
MLKITHDATGKEISPYQAKIQKRRKEEESHTTLQYSRRHRQDLNSASRAEYRARFVSFSVLIG